MHWPLSARIITALALALLPLGVLALAVAWGNFDALGASQQRLAQARAEALRQSAAQRLEDAYATLRAASAARERPDCAQVLGALARRHGAIVDLAVVRADGRIRCASGAARLSVDATAAALGSVSDFPQGAARDAETGDLLLVVRDLVGEGGAGAVVGRIPAGAVEQLFDTSLMGAQGSVELRFDGEPVAAVGAPVRTAASDRTTAQARLLPGLVLKLALPRPPVTTVQALGVLLPALMWLTALAISWLLIDRIVVKPLTRMKLAVERYGAGARGIRMAEEAGSGAELLELGQAFDRMSDEIEGHDAEMRASLAQQKALTREVHHRVKNNLQIVSSLISLQARDVTDPAVVEAYALIRQRVNALALVHRWMYAEEGGLGVDMRALVADLCGNLSQALADSGFGLTCQVPRLRISQDTALPLAFLITELASGAASAGAADMRVSARRNEAGDRATLRIESSVFASDQPLGWLEDGSRRILLGLSRQLRAPLREEAAASALSIEFPVLSG